MKLVMKKLPFLKQIWNIICLIKAIGLLEEQNPIMGGGVEAADSCMANLPLLTPLLNFKPVGFFGLCVCVVFRGFSFWGFVLFLFLYLCVALG